MYKFHADFWSLLSAQPESKVVSIVLPPKNLPPKNLPPKNLPPKNLDSDLEHIQQLEEENLNTVTSLLDDCEIYTNNHVTKTFSEQQLGNFLSNLLKYGALIASAIILLGGILYLIAHGTEPAEYHYFRGEPSQFRSPVGVVNAVLSGSRRGIIQLGLLLLIATPIVRVVISLLIFLWRREFIYVIITSLVLASLTYSLVGAY